MEKKAYAAPAIEVAHISTESFIAASLKDDGTRGSLSNPEQNGDAIEAMGKQNFEIHDVWE